MTRSVLIALVLVLPMILSAASSAQAFDVALSLYKLDDKVQDNRGQEAFDALQPGVSIGHDFDFGLNWIESMVFSPRVGYAYRLDTGEGDSYGKQKVSTLYLLYDFATPLNDMLRVRYGIANFIKTVSGEGGTVTIPNGNSTATAYRPSESRTAYTAALNLGVDATWQTMSAGSILGYRLSGELHLMNTLNEKKRLIGLQVFFGLLF